MTIPKSYLGTLEFVYVQSTGCLYLADHEDGRSLIARGYSGKGVGYNEPSYEDRVAEGPIPRGVWRLQSPIRHQRLGPVSIPLTPQGPIHGRSGFYIHGDNLAANGTASSGCIILPPDARTFIAGSGVRRLIVEA